MALSAPGSAEPRNSPSPTSGLGGDRIAVTGISAVGHHGVFDFERRDGQTFVVDVLLDVDLAPAATTDDLDQTIDYGQLASAVAADITGEPLDLIEALAERIAQTCLGYDTVDQVQVTVHKPHAPMPVPVTDVAVTLTRKRTI